MKKTTTQKPVRRRTELGLQLEQAALEILAHVKGEKALPSRKIVLPDPVVVSHQKT